MSKPFDIGLKELIDNDPRGWAQVFCPEHVLNASLIESETATVSASADKVLRVELASGPVLLNLEPQSGHDASFPQRLHLYSTLLSHRHGLGVHSVALLLRPEANATAITGIYERPHAFRAGSYLRFEYDVVRLWEQPLDRFLQGPLALVPLAPLTDEALPQLTNVVQEAVQRVRTEADPDRRDTIEATLFLLLGLRFDKERISRLEQTIMIDIRESSTYELWMERREARALRQIILRMGRKKFGEPTPAQVQAVESMTDLERMHNLTDKLLDVTTWEELLA
jgi:hypothetical protein